MVCVVAPVDHESGAKPGPASSVIGEPAHDVVGPVIVGVGAAMTVTFDDCVFGQPLLSRTVTLMLTVPLAGALKVMFGVFWPVRSAPPVTVQSHCVAVGAVTLALFAVEFAHAFGGALSVAGGTVHAAARTTFENSDVPSETVV